MTAENLPRVGTPSDEYRAVCLYSFRPADRPCDARATVHVVTEVPRGLAALPSCDEHVPIARAAGRFVAEHPHGGICGLPGSVWLPDRNVCVIDDSGVEPVLSAVAEVSR